MKNNSFSRNRMAMVCLWVLAVLYLLAIFADFISPYSYKDEERNFSYCPPTAIEFFDHGHAAYPFVYYRTLTFDAVHRRVYVTDKTKKYPLHFFKDGRLFGVDAPARLYLWGADARGRDLFSRIWYGARISLSIGLLGVAISFMLGLLIGGIAGFYGGWVDGVLMRVCEMFMMLPGFYLMLALRAAVPENFNSVQVYFSVVVILAFIGWASLARIIRGMALSLRETGLCIGGENSGGAGYSHYFTTYFAPDDFLFDGHLDVNGLIVYFSGGGIKCRGLRDPGPGAQLGESAFSGDGNRARTFCPVDIVAGTFYFYRGHVF